MPLDPDDLEDALQALHDAGLPVEAFSFRFVPYPRLGCSTGAPLAEVVATDLRTGRERIYRVAAGLRWTRGFTRDLAAGEFPEHWAVRDSNARPTG